MRSIRFLAFFSLAALGANCGDDGSSGATFECRANSTSAASQCAFNTQYCAIVTTGGATTASCVAVPTSCAGATGTCACITGTLTGTTNRTCASLSFGSDRATTVSYTR